MKSLGLIFLLAALMPLSIFAQNKQAKVMVKEFNEMSNDSVLPLSFWSTEFDVDDLATLHSQLDNIFNELDEDFFKRVKVMAFKMDSLNNNEEWKLFEDLDVDTNIDSIFNYFSKVTTNDKRIEHMIKSAHPTFTQEIELDTLLKNTVKDMDVQVFNDSTVENGKTIITKKVIINGYKNSQENASPAVVKSSDDKGDKKILTYHNKQAVEQEGKQIRIEKGDREIKRKGSNDINKHFEEITLKDAELLVKAGISPKIIVSPALNPINTEVNIQVKEEYSKKVKEVTVSLDFNDEKPMEVILLDKDGNTISSEKIKKPSRSCSEVIEIREGLAPYYFLVIRDKKIFGRKIN
jgi:hypothetical protein